MPYPMLGILLREVDSLINESFMSMEISFIPKQCAG